MSEPKSLADQFKEVADAMPDKYTLAWWQKKWAETQQELRGANHGINKCWAAHEELEQAIREIREELASLKEDQDVDRAEIGRLREALEKARQAYKALKTG